MKRTMIGRSDLFYLVLHFFFKYFDSEIHLQFIRHFIIFFAENLSFFEEFFYIFNKPEFGEIMKIR